MQRLSYASIAVLALAITGCSGDSDETPDITEAIPLEVDEPASADGAGETGEATQDGNGDTPALPGSGDANGAAGEQRGRSIPDTMEAGSNPPDFEVPEGSKVQRAN